MDLSEAIGKLLHKGSALIGIATTDDFTFDLVERSNIVDKNNGQSEDGHQRKLLINVKITEIPVGSILLKMDKCRMGSGIQASTGLLKQCDYALIVPSMKHVSYIELKSTKIDRDIIRDQLRSSHCAFCYITHALKDVYDIDDVNCHFTSSYILMHTQAVSTADPPKDIKAQGKTPHDFRPIANPTVINFKLLI